MAGLIEHAKSAARSFFNIYQPSESVELPSSGLDRPWCYSNCKSRSNSIYNTILPSCVACDQYDTSIRISKQVLNIASGTTKELLDPNLPDCYWSCYEKWTRNAYTPSSSNRCGQCADYAEKIKAPPPEESKPTEEMITAKSKETQTEYCKRCLLLRNTEEGDLCSGCREEEGKKYEMGDQEKENKKTEEKKKEEREDIEKVKKEEQEKEENVKKRKERERLKLAKKRLEEIREEHRKDLEILDEEQAIDLKKFMENQKKQRSLLKNKHFLVQYSLIGSYHTGRSLTYQVDRNIHKYIAAQSQSSDTESSCSICLNSEPAARAAYIKCGHVVCLPCGEKWKKGRHDQMLRNSCLVCNTISELVRLYEH